MFQKFTSIILCVFLFAGFLLAQENAVSENSGKIPDISSSSRGALLWDNMLPAATTAIVSDQWGGRAPGNDITQCAEDFTVPGGIAHWNVNEIIFSGFFSATAPLPAQEFRIAFYDNNAGVPGNLITTRSVAPGPDPVQGTFADVTLTPGTYWISIYAFHDTATIPSTFRWNWYASNSILQSQPYLKDITGIFSANTAWQSFSSLGLSAFQALLFSLYGESVVPVELTSFTASVGKGQINLNWQTASEVNNYGFEVERSVKGNEFVTIGFVSGNGTTTEVKNYTFVDNNVTSGAYTYRLRQVDLDGTFEYSNEIEVDIELLPTAYSLNQNYPNPFNPSTKITFNLPVESNVTLKIFDILGQDIMNLVKGTFSAGSHNFDFDATSLNSGIYFYTLEAQGLDGSSFSEVKKMMLTK